MYRNIAGLPWRQTFEPEGVDSHCFIEEPDPRFPDLILQLEKLFGEGGPGVASKSDFSRDYPGC